MNTIYFDGGCKPNPGKMEVGLVFLNEDGTKTPHRELAGDGTNNQAEWLALLVGLSMALGKGMTKVKMIGDSKNVIMQASGAWKMKETSNLYGFWLVLEEMKQNFDKIEFEHVLRHRNLAGIMLEGK